MKEFKPQYSKNRSEKIWKAINDLPDPISGTMYSCFVLLQNMEHTCLTWLNNEISTTHNKE